MTIADADESIPTPDGPMTAFVAAPASDGGAPRPGVLLLMEAFGLTEHIRDVARRIAREGYVVLAPDLYHREPGRRTFAYDDVDEAMATMYRLDFAGGLERDLRAALAHLKARPDVRAERIGVTGFCLGGGVTFFCAVALSDQIAAAAGFYGMVPNEWLERVDEIRVPLLLLFGGMDPFIPLGRVAQIKSRLAEAGKDARIELYREADHGFFCDERDSYDATSAADAWEQLKAFFAAHLRDEKTIG
jgi:carboxymethylenebutenolidase